MVVVRGTKHQEISDVPSISPYFVKKMKIIGNVTRDSVFTAYDFEISVYLRKIFGTSSAIINALPHDRDALDISKDLVALDDEAFKILEQAPISYLEFK